MRLLTWQVTHHAAVKSTNTGRPSASARVVASRDQRSQRAWAGASASGVPICWASTHTSHATVANIGTAIAFLKCAIQAPGRGNQRASAGDRLAAR